MSRNLVVCSDGTGNTFQQRVSNVSRLVQALDLARRDAQLVFYDQGIGTNPHLVRDVKAFRRAEGAGRSGLEILDPPGVSLARPLAIVAGLAAGYGLEANLREMYQALARHHQPADQLFLFGFSRGAFTVRALAGLLYRCGLPARVSVQMAGKRRPQLGALPPRRRYLRPFDRRHRNGAGRGDG